MKKLITFFSLGLFTLLVGPQYGFAQSHANRSDFNIVQSDNHILHFTSAFNRNVKSMDVTTKIGEFSELSIEGYGCSNTVGEPKLPVLKQLIEVPVGAEFDV